MTQAAPTSLSANFGGNSISDPVALCLNWRKSMEGTHVRVNTRAGWLLLTDWS